MKCFNKIFDFSLNYYLHEVFLPSKRRKVRKIYAPVVLDMAQTFKVGSDHCWVPLGIEYGKNV